MRTTTTGREPATSLEYLGAGTPAQIDHRLSTYAEDKWLRHRLGAVLEVAELLGSGGQNTDRFSA
jgi:hypothetical protein